MKKTSLMAAMAAVLGGALLASATTHAQTRPLEVWQPPQGEADPARRVPATAPTTPAVDSSAASVAPASGAQTVVPVAPAWPYSAAPVARDLGGFFLGVQGGKGWVYDDVDQTALMVNAGYRW